MQIILNEKPMDIKIENENNLGEVISGIEDWLAKEGYVINTIIGDDKNYDISRPDEWSAIAIDEIETLKIDALLAAHARINHLETVALYFQDLKSYLENKDIINAEELLSSIEGVIGSFENLIHPSLLQTAPIELFLNKLRVWENNVSKGNTDVEETLLKILEILISLTIVQLKELADPELELNKTFKVLKDMLPGLTDLSLLLQTGKDKEALNLVITLTEVLNKAMRMVPAVSALHNIDINQSKIEENNLPEFFTQLNEMLVELSSAFESGDSVLIGDLTEYEIVPRLENLIQFKKTI